jgi:hypothetical protein
MSGWISGAVAVSYAASVLGLHRLNVHRLRGAAGGFVTLTRLDWDTLLEGVLPLSQGPVCEAPLPREGGPAPQLLSRAPQAPFRERHQLLCALVAGAQAELGRLEEAGFSGGEARWLSTLALARSAPLEALERLEAAADHSPAELYLREHLVLSHRVNLLNLEVAVFAAKRRIAGGLQRYTDHPALHFVRARASALLGFNTQALDALGRAVYFSRQAPFYLTAVTELPYVIQARPVLDQQCRAALAQRAAAGSPTLQRSPG